MRTNIIYKDWGEFLGLGFFVVWGLGFGVWGLGFGLSGFAFQRSAT